MTEQEMRERQAFEQWAEGNFFAYERISQFKRCWQAAYAAGRADQREADAKVCDDMPDAVTSHLADYAAACVDCAAAIRSKP